MKISLQAKSMLGEILCDNWRHYELILFLVSDTLRKQNAGCELTLQTEFLAPGDDTDVVKLPTVKTVTDQCCSPSRNWMEKFSKNIPNYELTPKGRTLIQPLLDGETIEYRCHDQVVNLFDQVTLKKINDLVGQLTNRPPHDLREKVSQVAVNVLREQENVPYYGFSPGYKVIQP